MYINSFYQTDRRTTVKKSIFSVKKRGFSSVQVSKKRIFIVKLRMHGSLHNPSAQLP